MDRLSRACFSCVVDCMAGKAPATGRMRPVAVGMKLGGRICVESSFSDDSEYSGDSWDWRDSWMTRSSAALPIAGRSVEFPSLQAVSIRPFSCDVLRRRASVAKESRVTVSRESSCWIPGAIESPIVALPFLALNVTASSVAHLQSENTPNPTICATLPPMGVWQEQPRGATDTSHKTISPYQNSICRSVRHRKYSKISQSRIEQID